MMIRTILLAVDMEHESQHLIDYGFELAEQLGAILHVAHAYPIVVVPTGDGTGSIPYEALHERARARLLEATARWARSPSMGKCVVDLGDPRLIVIELASALSADLIIVGTHARKGMQRLLLGSVAESILREARAPVLVVKSLGASATGAAR